MAWADSHTHVHDARVGGDPRVDDAVSGVLAASFADSFEAGVHKLVTVGTDELTSAAALAVADWSRARSCPVEVWATAGVHPHDAAGGWDWLPAVLQGAPANGVVAVGECGFDYYYEHSPRAEQRVAFASQIALANRFTLPLVIHTRDAWEETFEVLRTEGVPRRTVFHCFTGGPDEARACLDLGAYLSFSGIVTFKTAESLRAAAALTPLDRLLVETDAPYLAPVPHRGKSNRPAWVPFVGQCIASVKGVTPEVIEQQTWANTDEAFDLVTARAALSEASAQT